MPRVSDPFLLGGLLALMTSCQALREHLAIMMRKRIPGYIVAMISVILTLQPGQVGAQTIRFVRESLDFTLAADFFRFTGLYYFDNPGPDTVRREIFYPYVLLAEPPETTTVMRVSSGEETPASTSADGVSFSVTLPPFSTEAYRVTFSQRSPRRLLEYILTTTAAWGRPLERMSIAIEVPAGLDVRTISMKPSTVSREGNMMVYTIKRTNIMPGRNLTVKWKRRNP